MRKLLLSLSAVVALTGCVSPAQFLTNKEVLATMTAATRAQVELNCQDTNETTVLSSEAISDIYGPFGGVDRLAKFTIGVRGCGKKIIVVVYCPDGDVECSVAGSDGPTKK